MEFTYTAVHPTGRKQKGLIEANSETEIAQFLKKNGLVPITISRRTHRTFIALPVGRVGSGDIIIFTRQLASMLLTGLTLIESLNILRKQVANPEFKKIIDSIVANISEGKSFSDALMLHKDVFSEMYIALVQASESGGLLDKIMDKLATNLEKSDELKKNVKSALLYPAVVMVGMIGIIALMNLFVIPQLGSLYKSLHVELPLMTQIVLDMSDAFVSYWYFALGGTVAAFYTYRNVSKTYAGKKIIDKVKLKLPVLGAIIRLSVLVQVTSTLSLIVRSGASIIDALTITSRVADNLYYREAIQRSSELVEKGISLSTAFQNQQIFPLMLIQMIKVGEETGKIDDSMQRVSEYFERDLNNQIKTLTSSLEPLLIILLGGMVGFLVLSVILPIYSIITSIH